MQRSKLNRRRGGALLEFVIGFPLVIFLTLGLIDTLRYWAVMIIAQSDAANSVRLAARLSQIDNDLTGFASSSGGCANLSESDQSTVAALNRARELVATEATKLGRATLLGGPLAQYVQFQVPTLARPLDAVLLRPLDRATRVSDGSVATHPSSDIFCSATYVNSCGVCMPTSGNTFSSLSMLYPYVMQIELDFRFLTPFLGSRRISVMASAFRERTWIGALTEPFQAAGSTRTATPTPVTPTSTPTVTPTNAPTFTPTVTPTATPTHTPTQTPTQTPTRTLTPTITPGPSPTPTVTPTVTPTPTITLTPTRTPTRTPTFTSTVTPTVTPTRTPTRTPTNTPTTAPTATPTVGEDGGADIGN